MASSFVVLLHKAGVGTTAYSSWDVIGGIIGNPVNYQTLRNQVSHYTINDYFPITVHWV